MMLEYLVSAEFWVGLFKIIGVNIILSGDNAVVIALAARSLPKHQQKQAIFWGAGAAVVLRIALTIVAVKLLEFPYLKLAGGAALLWIAVKLLVPEDEDDGEVAASTQLWGAVKTILIADLIMSTDNVIAVAAAGCRTIGISRTHGGFAEVSPNVASEMILDSEQVVVLDVRSSNDYRGPEGHIAGSLSAPFDSIERQLSASRRQYR